MNYEYDYSTAIGLAQVNDLWQSVITEIVVIATIFSIVVFLYWFYRAYRNLPALGATRLKFNPKWVIVYFFIPILALWKPFRALEEIYTISTNDYSSRICQLIYSINLVDSFYRIKYDGIFNGPRLYQRAYT